MKGIKCVDHLGNEFSSQAKMCEAWNISVLTYRSRLKKGLSQEEALTMPLQDTSVYDHLGNKFPSELQMCKFYNIKLSTFHIRLKRGYSLERALTEAVIPKIQNCKDHIGNTYNSINDMCKAYNISSQLLKQRLNKGWTIEAALTTPTQKTAYDHLGNAFSSKKEMCDHYGITVFTYRYREQNGMTLEEILTLPKNTYVDRYVCKDHLGNIFSSKKEMCEYYGVSIGWFIKKQADGCSLEECLSKRCFYDHLGNKYSSIKEMCDAYKITPDLFSNRFYMLHWSLKNTLTLPVLHSHSSYEYCIYDVLNDLEISFEAEYYNFDCFLSGNGRARFDVYIPSIGIIEVDGEQHFKPVRNWNFEKTVRDDTLKTVYCENNNIPLLRVRYDQMQDGTYAELVEDFINNPAAYIMQHNKYLSEKEYYAERTKNLSVAS